jgi:UDP-N-acetylmuramate--alanine ligase
MPLLDSNDARPVHFVGIAGAGMSALAELLVRRGVRVTGCDAHPETADDLRRLGITVDGHNPDHVGEARAVVVTSAMPKDHPEVVRARALGIPVIRRAEALGEVTAGRELVAISGTHGKTTTTALTATALAAAARQPTALVGGRVAAWEGNVLSGGDRLYVVEADEYDRSFLALAPTIAIVTNVELDHLDIYADFADIRGAFIQFIRAARTIVLCADDSGATGLPTPSSTEVIRYGIAAADEARLLARNVEVRASGGGSAFDVVFDDELLGRATVALPGRHNVLNALAAVAAGLALGAEFDALATGLASFAGTERRFQRLGQARGIVVVDDYAHHPTEIGATLAAARLTFPGQRIVAAFQPHLYSRTRDFAREFGESLSGADIVYLTEIYPAREQPIPGVTSALVADAIASAGGVLAWRGERTALADALAGGVRDGDVVLTIGAGDITKTGPELLERLR